MKISIDGIIGCGKTTQIQKLINLANPNLQILPEEVEHWVNEGWVQSFYDDPVRNCLGFQLRVLRSHANALNYKDQVVITERSAFTSANVFGKMALEGGLMTMKEFQLNKSYYQLIGWQPDIIFFLDCSPNTAFGRIQSRNRASEHKISLDYLNALDHTYKEVLRNSGIEVRYIDANGDEDIVFDELVASCQNYFT